jgi:DNA-binding response OmpR family regulator
VIQAGAVQIDHAARRVFVADREVPLSPTEYRLIYHLAVNSGKVVSHRDLLQRAFSHGEGNLGNLKVYIGRLRAKLNSGREEKCDLRAVRGVGYRRTA